MTGNNPPVVRTERQPYHWHTRQRLQSLGRGNYYLGGQRTLLTLMNPSLHLSQLISSMLAASMLATSMLATSMLANSMLATSISPVLLGFASPLQQGYLFEGVVANNKKCVIEKFES